jgi:hypothetical protein
MKVYKKAFQCAKCPGNSGEDGCPNWHEIVQENIATGEVKITKSCGFPLWMEIAVELIKSANRPAAEMGQMRHEIMGFLQNTQNSPALPPLPNVVSEE